MRFTTFFSLASIASVALCAPSANPEPGFLTELAERLGRLQQNNVVNALTLVRNSIDQLDTSVRGVKKNDLDSFAAVANSGTAVNNSLKKAQAMIDASMPVDLMGAFAVQTEASALTRSMDMIADTLIEKKPVLESAGLAGSVLAMLNNQKSASTDLAFAVQKKLPAIAAQLAQGEGGQATRALQRVILAYADVKATAAMGTATVPKATKAPKKPKKAKPTGVAAPTGTAPGVPLGTASGVVLRPSGTAAGTAPLSTATGGAIAAAINGTDIARNMRRMPLSPMRLG